MADREKKAQDMNSHTNSPNVGASHTRAADRRRKEVVEIGPGEGGRLPGMTKEYSAWDVYNNEARKVDTELVNDWRDSLNSLLLFAAIFAAVLTAFIIESKKMLELDPTTVMMDVMIFYTNSVANGTHKPYTPSTFEPESYAVKVNCLFFASLSTSLVAALASVVALQWVADYDAAITRGGSSPEDRAKRRQFRHAGVVWWKMGDIIAALPLLLYCSVILFFGGLALWMWEVNNVVGLVVLGGAALAVLFYGTSTFLSVVFVSAPFRTPLGRWIYSSARLLFSSVYHITSALRVPLIPTWLEKRNFSSAMLRRREDVEVESRPSMGLAALVWLANELPVSQDAYDRLFLLVGELPNFKPEISLFPGFLEPPWYIIFDLLGWKNLRNTGDESITPHDVEVFGVLAQCYRIPEIHDIISPSPIQHVADASNDEYWSQYCDITEDQWSPQPSPTRPNSLFLLLRDIPLPSTDAEIDIGLTIRLSRWRNSPHSLVNTGDALCPRIAPSIAFAALSNESIVNVGTYPKANEFPLWISRDDGALYIGILRRMMSTLGTNGTIPPGFLDALRWRFEVLLGIDMVDKLVCLSTPTQYYSALRRSSTSVQSLHYAFALLLARNLNSFEGEERVFRCKEILMMLWASPVRWRPRGGDEVGMERFFEANKTLVMGWIYACESISYIDEILSHLGVAQAEEPKIGPLWRVIHPQEEDNPGLLDALFAFDSLIGPGITPEQHCKLVDLVCRDLALGPPQSFKDYSESEKLYRINKLRDSCLRLLAQFVAGSGDSFYLSSQNIDGPLKDSWARIATYFMTHPEGISSPSILRLQGSLWSVLPNRRELCSSALRDPGVFTHLQRMFEYPISCRHHHDIEGHIFFHIFEGSFGIDISVDMTAFTTVPIRGRETDILSTFMAIPETQYGLFTASLRQSVNEKCLAMTLEIVRELRASQYSMLAFLSNLPARFIVGPGMSLKIACSEDLACMSMGIINALDLPNDPRVALLIPSVVSGILKVKKEMYGWNRRVEWENQAADKEAAIAVDKLMTHLSSMMIFGGRNSKVVACVRSRETHSPAVGWLPMHTE